jgi:hypothetical protein
MNVRRTKKKVEYKLYNLASYAHNGTTIDNILCSNDITI